MAVPVRYLGETFQVEGRWLRQGKVSTVVVADGLDTSRIYCGKSDPTCESCREGWDHSSRHHRLSVIMHRKAICAPPRSLLHP